MDSFIFKYSKIGSLPRKLDFYGKKTKEIADQNGLTMVKYWIDDKKKEKYTLITKIKKLREKKELKEIAELFSHECTI